MLQTDIEQNNCTQSEMSDELKTGSYPPVPQFFSDISTETVQNSLRTFLLTRSSKYDLTEPVGTFEITQTENGPKIDGTVISLKIDNETKKFTKIRYSSPIIRSHSNKIIEWIDWVQFGPVLDKVNLFYNSNIEFFTPSAPELYIHRVLFPILSGESIDSTIEHARTHFSKFLIPLVELNDMKKPPSNSKTHLTFEFTLPEGWTFTRKHEIDSCIVNYFDKDNDEIFTILIDWIACKSSVCFNNKLFGFKYENIVGECSRYFLDLRESNLRILNDIKTKIMLEA